MAVADYHNIVQTLYISYFGRPADPIGLDNFATALNNLGAPTELTELKAAAQTDFGIGALINTFSASAESADLYGTGSTLAFVTNIYENLLNRAPDFDGLKFWVTNIENGTLSRANASLAIAEATASNTSAQGVLDAQLVAAKVAVAIAFTDAIDTGAELGAYEGAKAITAGQALLGDVTATTTAETFATRIETTLSQLVTGSNVGQTVALTTGVDTLNGTSGNDVFNLLSVNVVTGLEQSNLGAFDVVNGGAGVDTLNIFATATANNTLTGSVTNVENIVISGADNIDKAVVSVDPALSAAAVSARVAATVAAQADVAAVATQVTATQTAQAATAARAASNQAVAADQAATAAVAADQAAAAAVAADQAATAAIAADQAAADAVAADQAATAAIAADQAAANAIAADQAAATATANSDPNAPALQLIADQTDAAALQVTANQTDAAALQVTANLTDAVALQATADQTDAAALQVTAAQTDAVALQATANLTDATALVATAAQTDATALVAAAVAAENTAAIAATNALNAAVAAQTDAAALNAAAIQAEAAAAASATTRGQVNASFFGGSDSITLVQAAATDVTNVTNQTVVLKNAAASSSTGINYASTATAGTVNLDSAAGTVILTGSKLATATLSGSVKAVSSSTAGTVTVVDGSTTDTIKTLNVALTSNATVNLASAAALTAIAAGDSTGGLKLTNVGNTVAEITTGSGADEVTLSAALNGTIKAATLNAGAGDDTIVVSATATGTGNTVTVDGGAGNDEITLTIVPGAAYNVTGGAGNDTIAVTGTVKTTDVISGGDGTDTIELTGAAAYVADNYIVFNKVLQNFEGVSFTSAAGLTTAIDASQLAGYKAFTFGAGGSIAKVAADQVLSTADDLTVVGNGWTAADKLGTTAVTVAATNDADIIVSAQSVNLTATALSDAAAGVASNALVTLAGSFATANIVLANGVTADDTASVAKVTVSSTAAAVTTSLTFSGSGEAEVTQAANSKLVNIDAAALASVNEDGDAAAGLTVVSAATAAETIKLGAGIDTISLNASTYGAMDTVTGLNLSVSNGVLNATSDNLNVGAGATFAKFTTTQTDFQLAVRDAAAAAGANLVFSFGGDTYVFVDAVTANALDAGDTLVKLTGAVDLDALILTLAPVVS